MRLRALLLALLFVALVLPLPTHGDGGDCSAAAPLRLAVGGRARVALHNGVLLRANPGDSYRRVATLDEGIALEIVGGPTCADSMQWWQVKTIDGRNGWLIEAGDTGYQLEPIIVSADLYASRLR